MNFIAIYFLEDVIHDDINIYSVYLWNYVSTLIKLNGSKSKQCPLHPRTGIILKKIRLRYIYQSKGNISKTYFTK